MTAPSTCPAPQTANVSPSTSGPTGKGCSPLPQSPRSHLQAHSTCSGHARQKPTGTVASNLPQTGEEPTQRLGLPHSSTTHITITAEGLCFPPSLAHLFHLPHRSFCWEHRPQQTAQARPSQDNTCSICLDTVENKISYKTMGCPACQDARFHRQCIQRLALHAGIGFRCPCCLNQDPFIMEMLTMGIRLSKRLGFLLPGHKVSSTSAVPA